MTDARSEQAAAADRSALHEVMRGAIRHGAFTLSSGKTSDFYFDGRLVSLSAAGMPVVGRMVNRAFTDEDRITAIGGPTLGADPIAAAAVMAARESFGRTVDCFLVRKEAKGHGAGKLVEGPALGPDSRVIVVEDTITTGGSVLKACNAIRETGATIVKLVVLLDREEGGREKLEEAGLTVEAVFTKRDFPAS